MFRELRDTLMENIRYGKRTEQVDELLGRLTTLIALVNQMPAIQTGINLNGIEKALSPRCASCTDACRPAFRKTEVFLRKVIRAHASRGEAQESAGS
jgi:hypothetical protein